MNRRDYGDSLLILVEISILSGKPSTSISGGNSQGYSDEEALSKPVRKQNRGKVYSFKGESHTLVEWSKILDIKRNTLYLRLYNNWTTEEAFTGIKNGVKY